MTEHAAGAPEMLASQGSPRREDHKGVPRGQVSTACCVWRAMVTHVLRNTDRAHGLFLKKGFA